MAELGRFADRLREDRDRQQKFLEETVVQIEALQDLASHLQQSIDSLDRLLAVDARAVLSDPDPDPPSPVAASPKKARAAKKVTPPLPEAPPAASPAAPPVSGSEEAPPVAGSEEGPRGTDALKLVLESEPRREYSLADLIDALKFRGWLPPSRRPEEGVRLSLKRLAERGGAVRTDNGRWRAPTDEDRPPREPEAPAPVGGAVTEWPRGTVFPPRR